MLPELQKTVQSLQQHVSVKHTNIEVRYAKSFSE